jgi:hypothetical protein
MLEDDEGLDLIAASGRTSCFAILSISYSTALKPAHARSSSVILSTTVIPIADAQPGRCRAEPSGAPTSKLVTPISKLRILLLAGARLAGSLSYLGARLAGTSSLSGAGLAGTLSFLAAKLAGALL